MVAGSQKLFGPPPSGLISLGDGYTAEYFRRGRGEPIVLVPGMAGGTGLLQPLMDELVQDHEVITFELRGEKSCILDRTFGFDRLVRDLAEVIDTLRLERPGLLGLSFGGAIALDYATRFPHRVGYVAVQGAGPNHRNRLFDGVARRVLDRMILPDNSPFLNQFFRLLTAQRSLEEYGLDFVIDQCWKTDQSVMAHRFELLEEYDITDRLDGFNVPTLVISAEQDLMQPPADASSLADAIDQSEVRAIEGAGHFAFVTHAKPLADHLRAFGQYAYAAQQ